MATKTVSFPFRRHTLALALALATGSAHAVTINVSGDCTLINAINNANTDTDTDGVNGCAAGNGADILELATNATYTLTAIDNTTDAANGLPVITSIITINGNSATIERPGTYSTPYFRLLSNEVTGNLTLNNLTLQGGVDDVHFDKQGGIDNRGTMSLNNVTIDGNNEFFTSNSGGIENSGTMILTDSLVSDSYGYYSGVVNNQGSMTLINSTVSDNWSYLGGAIRNHGNMTLASSTIKNNNSNYAGGISNFGDMTLADTLIYGNSAYYYTGGISNYGNMTLTNSQVSNNTAAFVGGISNAGSLTLTNCTISGNSSRQAPYPSYAGGINNVGTIMLTNCTVSENNASTGTGGISNRGIDDFGGIHNAHVTLINTTLSGNSSTLGGFGGLYSNGDLTLTNSLIANSAGGTDCFTLAGTAITLQGVNFIKDGTCGAPLTGDPKLGLLLDNGGPTFTHSLKTASPAIDKATSTLCPAFDQRGIKRPKASSNKCDIGSFEKLKRQTVPAGVQSIVLFFDTQVSSKGIKGIGIKDNATQLRDAVRNQLVAAGSYRDPNQACAQLTRTLTRIDTDNSPDADDYVTGNSGGLLVDEINALRIDWLCN